MSGTEAKTGLRFAYLGPEGSHSHQALNLFLEAFGSQLSVGDARGSGMPFAGFSALVDGIEGSGHTLGLLPVENALEGGVAEVMETVIRDGRLRIRGDMLVPVVHCLIRKKDDDSPLRRILSHPQAMAQCRQTIRKCHGDLMFEPAPSTSDAVRRLGELDEPGAAAIGTRYAANRYGLAVAAEDISDAPGNMTRFLLVSDAAAEVFPPEAPGAEDSERNTKTSICIGLKDRPGALVDLLLVFKAYGINLTRIESRPSRRRFGDYLFYIDAESDLSAPGGPGGKIMMYLEAESVFLSVNGPYPSLGALG